jgi:hypothetical protein
MSGQQFGLSVLAEDVSGNVDPNFSGPITLAISSAAIGGGTLNPAGQGTLTLSASGGSAAYFGLILDRATSYTLIASSGGLTSVKTGNIVVTANQLTFSPFPTNNQFVSSANLSIPVTALDITGQTAGNFSDTLTLTITSGPAKVGTKVSAAAASGVAKFPVGLTTPGTYNISVADPAKPAIQPISTSITVTANHLGFSTPPPATVPRNSTFTVVIRALGADGTLDSNFNGLVTLAANGPGSLSGSTSVTASGGVASFTVSLHNPGTYTLLASSLGLASAMSISFKVT